MSSSPIIAWQMEGENVEVVTHTAVRTHKPKQCVEKQRHYSPDKGLYIQSYGLPSGHIWL